MIKKFTAFCLLFIAQLTYAETFVNDFSLSVLRGNNYELGDKDRTVATLEYLSVGTWGDVFFFYDHIHSDNGYKEDYMELQPRIKVIKNDNESHFLGAYVATQWEHSETADNFLIGPGFDFKFLSFQFLQLNFYYRNNEKIDNNFQITPVWAIPFEVGNSEWLFDGFIDWTSKSDDAESSLNFTPQLKWNIGKEFGISRKLYLGIEYTYWKNKFGIKGVDENNANLLLKMHL